MHFISIFLLCEQKNVVNGDIQRISMDIMFIAGDSPEHAGDAE